MAGNHVSREPGMRAQFPAVCDRCGLVVKVADRIVIRRGHAIHVSCASGQDDE